MNIVERLEYGLAAAEKLGYSIRQEWLDGIGGGPCVLNGQRVLFIDQSEDIHDRLEMLLEVLREDPAVNLLDPTLLGLLERSRRA